MAEMIGMGAGLAVYTLMEMTNIANRDNDVGVYQPNTKLNIRSVTQRKPQCLISRKTDMNRFASDVYIELSKQILGKWKGNIDRVTYSVCCRVRQEQYYHIANKQFGRTDISHWMVFSFEFGKHLYHKTPAWPILGIKTTSNNSGDIRLPKSLVIFLNFWIIAPEQWKHIRT